MNFEALYVNPKGRTSRSQYVPAMITLLALMVFYAFVVTGRTAQFCMLVLLFPAAVLLATRLRDMGYSAWLALIPLVLMLVTYTIELDYLRLGNVNGPFYWVAHAVSAAFVLWGGIGHGQYRKRQQAVE